MSDWTPSFENMHRLTVLRSLANQEPGLEEIDPDLVDHDEERPYTREIRGEWGSMRNIRVFSGFVDEGGMPTTIELAAGGTQDICRIGHLNVDRAGDSVLERHLLDLAGVVYESRGMGYIPMTSTAMDVLVSELQLVL